MAALLHAEFPLIITSNAGRNPAAVPLLASLSSILAIGMLTVPGSMLSVPASHPHFLGFTFNGTLSYLPDADVVLLLETDVPWVDVLDNKPRDGAKVFLIGDDPLKRGYGWSHVDAEMICVADLETALSQLLEALRAPDAQGALASSPVQERSARLEAGHAAWLAERTAAEAQLAPDGVRPTVPYVFGALREAVHSSISGADKVLWMNESVSNAGNAWNHIRPDVPGSFLMPGGASIGWILGATVGASIGGQVAKKGYELVVAITGDGNFLFAVPTAAYWAARRYGTPFLTVVLNNGGWSVRVTFLLTSHEPRATTSCRFTCGS